MTREIVAFVAGCLAGIAGLKYADDLKAHFQAPKPPHELEEMAMELHSSSRKLDGLAMVLDQLAAGDELEEIERHMMPDVKKGWLEWKKAHHIS